MFYRFAKFQYGWSVVSFSTDSFCTSSSLFFTAFYYNLFLMKKDLMEYTHFKWNETIIWWDSLDTSMSKANWIHIFPLQDINNIQNLKLKEFVVWPLKEKTPIIWIYLGSDLLISANNIFIELFFLWLLIKYEWQYCNIFQLQSQKLWYELIKQYSKSR